MIQSLQIKNYAIIETLEIDFSKGLTIITGETGAGKSIILGALGLIMGKRADTKTLYIKDKKCVVEGVFDIRKYAIKSFFKKNDLDYEDELIIRREISPSGKSRAFINDSPVNLNILQQLSGALIDLHQQFATHDIHNFSFQLQVLDALANNKKLLNKYREIYADYRHNRRQLELLIEKNQNTAKETDFIKFQLEEFNEAMLQKGEQESLEQELNSLSNAEEIKRTLAAAFQAFSESEQSLLDQLENIGLSLGNIAPFSKAVSTLHERFNGLVLELQDLNTEFENLAEATEYDGQRILETQERLDLIYRLQKKHNLNTVEDLLALQENLENQLKAFKDLDEEIEKLEKKTEAQKTQLVEKAEKLRVRRQDVIQNFESKVKKMLGELAMPHATLKVDLQQLDMPGPSGMDEANFLFAANKGSELQSIKDVASGGELSRLTLIVKSLVASAIPLPTLIFDEIDTGTSGDVAQKMGRILRKISDKHQVLSITHSPQIASKADAHYFVYKKVKDDRTITRVRLLNINERVRAIATMLSQSPPSDSAIENAKELIGV